MWDWRSCDRLPTPGRCHLPPYEDRHSLPVEASASDGEPVFPLARAPAAQPVGMVPVLTGFEGPFRPDPDAEPRTSTFFLNLTSSMTPTSMPRTTKSR
jgi:hypothetical protein